MLIEVSEIHPRKSGGKVSRIVAADGQRYEIWPDKLDGVAPGGALRGRHQGAPGRLPGVGSGRC